MKKEDIFVVLGVLGIIGFFILAYVSMNLPPEPEEQTSQTPQISQPAMPQDGNFNPNYGQLSEEQIQLADIAIGALLNSSEGVTPPMISVVGFEPQDFTDASLGCPKPGETYAQVITPGYQVVLEAQGQRYDYRLTDQDNVILCEQ